MAYATTAKRKSQTAAQPTWKWDTAIRQADEARAKEVQAAQRRFRNA